jgi:hypothetical protein
MPRLKLTPKQERFCQCIVEGKTGVDAYKTAYDTQANSSTIRKEVKILMKRDDITARIEELRRPVINHAQNAAINDREKKKKLINDRIEACIEKGDDAAIARYLDILNKMDQEYITTNVNIDNKSLFDNVDNDSLARIIKLA